MSMLKHSITAQRRAVLFFAVLLLFAPAGIPRLWAGVTVITHGLNGNIQDWVKAMAMAIPSYPRYLGTNYTIYAVTAVNQGGQIVASTQKIAGGEFSQNPSGEMIVALDWSSLADGYSFNTYEVAAAVTPYLMEANFIPELGGRALAELPIHLIGHSRGGSLMCEVSRILGSNGIWVDHLTTLDPHPLNNDGFFDVIYFVIDAPARTYENVLFHDNYYQTLGWPVNGESVQGAYVRELQFLDGGYSGLTGPHSDTHLWYHATIDFSLPATDSVAWITELDRERWWTQEEQFGLSAGFLYSCIGNGDRLSTNRPAGAGRILDGYNQWWDFGAGSSENRTLLAVNSREWPNIIKLSLTGTNIMAQGQTNTISAFIQAVQGSVTDPFLTIFIDDDFHPWNGNERMVQEIPLSRNPTHQIGLGTSDFVLTATNSTPGVHSLLGRITGGGRTRYLYATDLLTVFSSMEPPMLAIAGGTGVDPRLNVIGRAGQRVVIEDSIDLIVWQPVSTNWLTSDVWSYFDSRGMDERRFYRARLQ